MAESQLRTLYESLRRDNYDVPGTYESFERTLTAPGKEGVTNRQTLYNSLHADGYDVPDTYESFANTLFVPQPKQQTAPAPQAVAEAPAPAQKTQAAGKATAPVQKAQPQVRAQTRPTSQQPAGTVAAFKLRRGGHDFYVTQQEVNEAGGLGAWAAKHPGAPVRVYMHGDGFTGHVDLSEASKRRKENGYKYTLEYRPGHKVKRNKSGWVDNLVEYGQEAKAIEEMTAPTKQVVEQLWSAAEKKQTTDARNNYDALNNKWSRTGDDMPFVDSSVRYLANETDRMKNFDLDKMSEEAWRRSGAALTQKVYQRLKLANPKTDDSKLIEQAEVEAWRLTNKAVYDYAVEKNMPKSVLEYFFKKVMDQNSVISLLRGTARSMAGTTGDRGAYEAAQEEYGKKHKVASVAGTVVGMGADPMMTLTGGAGGAAGKAVLNVGGRLIAKKAAGTAVETGTRLFANKLGAKVAAGVASGSVNLGMYEGLKEGERQFLHGGYINPETGQNEGYSLQAMFESAGKGAILGAATGVISPIFGNVGNKLVGKADRISSTGGSMAAKAGIRATQHLVATGLEGTIFATEGWLTTDEDKVDVWLDSMATMIGFKGHHIIKSAPRVIAGMRPVKPTADRPLTIDERNFNRKSFVERVSAMLDGPKFADERRNGSGMPLSFTKDDISTLKEAGYGSLADIFRSDRAKEADKPFEERVLDALGEDESTAEMSNGSGGLLDGYSEMEKLVKDASVPQEIRAKAYYALTGHCLGAGTITGHATRETDDGRIAVDALTNNGEIVYRRYYKSKDAANAATEKLDRQIELNKIDVGEQYADAVADETILDDVIKAQYPDNNPENIKKIYYGVKYGKARADEHLRKGIDAIDKEIEARKDEAADMRPDAIRKAYGEEYGVDIDDAIRKPSGDRSEAEKRAVESYIARLFASGETRVDRYDSKSDSYVSDVSDVADAADVAETQPETQPIGLATMKFQDGPVEVLSGRVVMTENGKMVDVERSDKTIVVRDPATGKTEMVSPEAMLSYEDVAPEVAADERSMPKYSSGRIVIRDADGKERRGFLTGDVDDQGRYEYYLAGDLNHLFYATEEELDNRVTKFVPDRRNDVADVSDVADLLPTQGKSDANVETADITIPERKGSDSVSDKQVSEAESSESALERLPRDEKGQPVFERAETPEIAWDALVELSDGDIADAKEMADIVTEQKRKALEKLQKQKPKGASLAELRESQKVIKAAREQAEQEYNFWQQMAGVEQPATVPNQPENVPTSGETPQNSTENAVSPAESVPNPAAPVENVQETPAPTAEPTPLQRLPRDEKGEPIFEQAETPEIAWDALVEFSDGDVADAKEMADIVTEQKRKALEKLQKQKPKGASLAELRESQKVIKAAREQAEQEYNFWQQMAGVEQLRQEAEARRLAEAKRRHEEEQYDEFCRQEYHLSAEEVEAYEDQLLAELSERDREFDANEYNDYIADEMARAAEITEQQKNGTEDNDTRRGSTPGDRRVQENDTEGKGTVPGRGYEVLPESRADQSSGAAADGDRSGIQPADGVQGDGPASAVAQGAQRGGIADVGRRKADDSPYGGLAEEVTSAIGPFGKIYTQFRGKPREAVTFLLAKRDGEAIGALHHKDVGEIDLVWGEEGSAHSDGFGLAKLAKYHPEVLFNLQEILNDMAVAKRSANRVQLESEKYKAAVRLTWDNQKKTWLLTMFEKKNSVLDNTTDTDKTHKGNGNDTATPENTVVSDRKDIDFASDKQASGEESLPQLSDDKRKPGLQAAVEAASAEVNTEPTEAQKKAGNYKKGHVTIGSFDITIENPAGSVRRGVDADGKEWSTTMANAYGEIRGTQSVDGDPIDVFLATDMDAWNGRKVFVVDQTNADGSFDEHKVMLGFNDKDEAMGAYLANYDKTWADTHPGLRITEASLDDFQKWVESSHRKTKAFADYSMVKGTAEAVARRQKDEAGLRTERPERGANYYRLKSDLVGFAKKFKDAGTANIPAIEREMSEWMSKQTADDIVDLDARMLSDVCNEAGLDKGKAWAFRMSVDHATPKGLIEEVFKIRNDRRAQIAPRGIADVDGFDMLSPESQAVVEHYLSEHGSKAIRVITGMDDIRALGFPKEVSEAFEEVVAEGGIPALYNSFDKKIYIFANVFNSARRHDGDLFHENVHGAIDECESYPEELLSSFRRKVVSSGYKAARFQGLESMLKKEYDEDSVDEEFLAYTLQWMFDRSDRESRIMELLSDEEKEFINNNILNKIRYAQRRRTSESASEESKGHETLHASRQRAGGGDGAWISRKATDGDEQRGSQGVAGESADGERSEGHGSLGAEVYEAAKGLLESAGVDVVEVSDTEAAEMLNRRGSDVSLMGSRTNRKMAKIAEYFEGRELDENQQAVVDVFSGKRDNIAIEVERPDGKRRVVMRQGNELKAGAKHSLFRHYESEKNNVIADDIALISEVIANGERSVSGNRVTYDIVAEDGTRLRVTTEITKKAEVFTNFYTNRKTSAVKSSSVANNAVVTRHHSGAQSLNPKVSDAKIGENSETGKPQLLKTSEGVVYGWTVGGKVYLNRDAMNPETPLHEYTHLWDEMVRRENPELWARGKELMKQTPMWQEVIEDPNYGDIRDDEDAVASEVHSRLTGKDGARILSDMIEDAKKDGPLAVAERVTLVERLKRWLGEMFSSLKKTLSQWSKRDLAELTVEDFVRMTLRDLAEGINPKREMQRGDQMRMVTKENPMLDDYHTGIRTREDVKTFDEMLSDAEANFREYGSLLYPDMDIEMLREAKRTGEITVYSSKPIRAGHFVTPSRMNAEDYAGGEKVYSKKVSIEDIAWISEDEGQFAPVHEVANDEGSRFHAAMSRGREEFDALRERAARETSPQNIGKNVTENERLSAIRALKPIKIERNSMSREELFAKYKSLPTVNKNGNKIRFLRTAFGKNYKEGGLFAQISPRLNDVLSSAVLAYSEKDSLGGTTRPDGTKHKAHPNVLSFDNYVNKVSIENCEYYVRMTVQNTVDNTTGLHSCFVSDIDLYENTAIGRTDSAISRRPNDSFSGIVDAKLQQFFERASSVESKNFHGASEGENGASDEADSQNHASGEADVADVSDEARISPEAKRSHAEKLAKKFNTPITIVDDVEKLPAAMRNKKGGYDVRNGNVIVVIPNHADVEDVAETVFHEVVAHKGLREMLGEGNYDDFCDEIYGHLKDDLKRQVDTEAGRRFMREPEKGYEHHRRVAVDELFGRMAEKGFEDFTKAERGIWAKLKAKVLEAINKFLGSLKLPKWVRLGDNELRYILWRSHERLGARAKAQEQVQNEALDFVDMARDVAKRAELGLNKSDVIVTRSRKTTADRIEESFDAAVAGELTGKPVEIGRLTKEGREYLEKLSGLKLKETVSFVLNPSDLAHIYRRHFGKNETDARNIPLTKDDIRQMAYVVSSPDKVIFGKEKSGNQRNMFFFLKETDNGSYNLMEVYSDRKGNLTAKSYFKSKEGVSQRAMLLNESSTLTSVTDGATLSDSAKLPKFFESATISEEESFDFRYRDGETGDIWKDQSIGLKEKITYAALRLSKAQADDLTLRNDAMAAIGDNLKNLLHDMRNRRGTTQKFAGADHKVEADIAKAKAAQLRYDRSTVKRVGDLARILMQTGYLSDMTSGEILRLMSAVKNSVGGNDIESSVDKIMDIMIGNQLRNAEDALHSLLSIRGSKVDSRGVEVQGELDIDGQRTIEVVKRTINLNEDNITSLMDDARDRMGDSDKIIADNAAIEYAGLNMALDYAQNIANSKAEEAALRYDLKTANEDMKVGRLTENAYKQLVDSIDEAIRKNKIERAEAYFNLVGRLSDSLRESIENAKAFRNAEKARVIEIQHNANSDMEGRPSNEHHKDDWKDRLANGFSSTVLAPLGTFDQILRTFGNKSVNGEGYLWNRFMRGWVDCRNKELLGVKNKFARLDEKVAEICDRYNTLAKARGDSKNIRKVKNMADMIKLDGKLPTATVKFWDGGEMREHELTQGNLLYIYMVDKMTDGRMKLRRMGITEEDIASVEKALDPRFKEFGDWLQEEFLVETRNEYNETHKRIFGASMAAIENYFPLKILSNARADKEEDLDQQWQSDGITTKTGSIIKRRTNSLALDIMGSNALSVVLDHITEMEHWNAYVEWNRDLNTLRTYKRFRNQVINMATAYGGGEKLWKRFNNLCRMAAGRYRPPISELDKGAVNLAKGVTAAKVSLRIFTALKQFLSAPAYIPEVSVASISKSLLNPYGDFKWCMENLPIFYERWHSRISGDPRLLKGDGDWKMWRQSIVHNAARLGMTPNAFVDALTVSIGARAIYQTRLKRYLKEGYTDEEAEKRAKQDATILFNQTQQSSEAPFMSTMQADRTWINVLFTVFRNSSMSYTRQEYDALRNLKRNLTPGQRAKSIEFMTKQILRDWDIDPDTATDAERNLAQSAAKKRFRRQLKKDVVRLATFGFILQLAWNLGAYLPYIIFGDDEDEKDKMWDDALTHAYFGSLEGLTGGDVMSGFFNMWASGEWDDRQLTKDMPLASDISSIIRKFAGEKNTEAINDIINLAIQSGIGVNPQSITDVVVAITDACGDDPRLSHEAAICIMRILQVPQSQLDKMYFDEVGLSGREISQYTPGQLAQRYAEYRIMRGTPFVPWPWGDEEQQSKYEKSAQKKIKERLAGREDDEVVATYEDLDDRYKSFTKKIGAVKEMMGTDYIAAAQEAAELQNDPDFKIYQKRNALDAALDKAMRKWPPQRRERVKDLRLESTVAGVPQSKLAIKTSEQKKVSLTGELNRIANKYFTAETPEEARLIADTMAKYRALIVDAMQTDSEAEQEAAISELSTLIHDFRTKEEEMRSTKR